MTQTLIPQDLLAKPQSILFITHLALGDFTYLQNFFASFAKAFPHLRIHLWIDEVRRTSNQSKWPGLQKYSLYDWAAACPYFRKVYTRTYSPALYRESIEDAQDEQYGIVVSLATLRPNQYANLAREISPTGFVVGMKKKPGLFQFMHHLAYRKLDATLPTHYPELPPDHHISDVYAEWFKRLFGLTVPFEARLPYVNIPSEWISYAHEQFKQWGFDPARSKVVFINAFAKTKKRCWPLERVGELISAMQKEARWRDAQFIINAMPQDLAAVQKMLQDFKLQQAVPFSAVDNFFQLPAVLSQCHLIISVETAVMHLANAVHVPVIALMRMKNPEWAPIDKANSQVITALNRNDWVDAIPVATVMKSLP